MANGDSSWLKWLVGTVIALLAAGSGIVALLNYFDDGQQPPPSNGAESPNGSDDDSDGLRVVESSLRADPFDYEGPCPVTIAFSGRISTVGGAGTVSYRFVRSDGASGPVEALEFEGPGSQGVETTWTLGGPSLPTFNGWEAIRVLEPDEAESNRAEFNIRCTS